jgi:hypothetical protein
METLLTDFIDDYRKMGLSDIYVLDQYEDIRRSGMEEEKRRQTVAAKKGSAFIKTSVSEFVTFMPSGRTFSVTSNEQITSQQYRELISNKPALLIR